MSVAAVAVEVKDKAGKVIPAVIGKLETEKGSYQLCMIITNGDAYDVFNEVTLPFSGKLKLGGSVEYYEQKIDIPVDATGITLRVGGVKANPNDIVLPPAVPFV